MENELEKWQEAIERRLRRLEEEVITSEQPLPEQSAKRKNRQRRYSPRQQERKKCPMCDLVLPPGPLAWHQRTTGHESDTTEHLPKYRCIQEGCDYVDWWGDLVLHMEEEGHLSEDLRKEKSANGYLNFQNHEEMRIS